jgi:hypothetical protein
LAPRDDAFRPHDDGVLDQGDILANVPFVKWKDGVPGPGGGKARGIITAHGCWCEDYYRAIRAGRTQQATKLMLHVAPVVPARTLPEENRAQIEAGGYFDRFYVYGDGGQLEDHVLDFSKEQTIPAHVLAECPKIARIDHWQWARLLIHQTVSRFRQPPEELFREDLEVVPNGEDADDEA